jgi:hypothetical protein
MRLADVARQAKFAAMQPGQITQHYREQDADLRAFERACKLAVDARHWRRVKAASLNDDQLAVLPPSKYEAWARMAERRVREISIQSEIILQRRFEMAQADRAMLRAMMSEAA